MKISAWVKNYRKEHGLSMQAFGDMCGLSKAYISILEKDVNPTTGKSFVPTIQTLKKIADATNTDVDLLFSLLDGSQKVEVNASSKVPQPSSITYTLPPSHGEDSVMVPVPGGYRIPVLGRVVAGVPINAVTDISGYEEIPERMGRGGEFFALEIKGRSMEPTLHEGDVVIVRQQPEVENGEIAIVLINGDEATVKEVKESPEGITLIGHNVAIYTPHFYNRKEIESLPIQILGKVVELRRKF